MDIRWLMMSNALARGCWPLTRGCPPRQVVQVPVGPAGPPAASCRAQAAVPRGLAPVVSCSPGRGLRAQHLIAVA